MDITKQLEEAGLYFEDGILGGVGSGGGGYYDYISDKISGFHLDKFDEDEFNNWYDNLSKNSLNSATYYRELGEENEDEINYDLIKEIGKGIYNIGEEGLAEIDEEGNITLYAIPTIVGRTIFTPISMYNNIVKIDKNELKELLQQNITKPMSCGIV